MKNNKDLIFFYGSNEKTIDLLLNHKAMVIVGSALKSYFLGKLAIFLAPLNLLTRKIVTNTTTIIPTAIPTIINTILVPPYYSAGVILDAGVEGWAVPICKKEYRTTVRVSLFMFSLAELLST